MKKWYAGLGTALLLCVLGAFSYTTIAKAKTANPEFERLTKCANEKNPNYLLAVVEGAIEGYHKDVEKALRARSEREGLALLKKHRTAIIHTIDFLFHDSHHFRHTFEHEAHKPHFEKVLNEHIQKMYHVEYHAAHKHTKEQRVITKDYQDIVKEFKRRGVKRLTAIQPPKGKEGMPFRQRMSEGASDFVSKVKSRFHRHKGNKEESKKKRSREEDEQKSYNEGGEESYEDYNPDEEWE